MAMQCEARRFRGCKPRGECQNPGPPGRYAEIIGSRRADLNYMKESTNLVMTADIQLGQMPPCAGEWN